MTIKNGDLPAMPVMLTETMSKAVESGKSEVVDRITGLTKREQFAAMAMQGILCCDNSEFSHIAAQRAVECADALLAELERTK